MPIFSAGIFALGRLLSHNKQGEMLPIFLEEFWGCSWYMVWH